MLRGRKERVRSGSLSGTVATSPHPPELGAGAGSASWAAAPSAEAASAANAKLGFNLPVATPPPPRSAYYNRIGGYMDAVPPDSSVEENVNTRRPTGVRATVRIAPSEELSITPRVLSRSEMDGWNRLDTYNILANPFTTTRPAVSLGEREQFIQIPEPVTDEFLLADLNVRYDFGAVELTSITTFTDRDVLVVRDATALTGSITGGSIGLPESVYTIDAPLDDATQAKVWTQELRLAGTKTAFNVCWRVLQHRRARHQQSLRCPAPNATRHPTGKLRRGAGTFSLLPAPELRVQAVRGLGKGTCRGATLSA